MSSQAQSPFFSALPPELREKVYEQYTLDYIKHAADAVAVSARQRPRDGRGLREPPPLVAYESSSRDGPPLMRACKQMAVELRPIMEQYLHFNIGYPRLLGVWRQFVMKIHVTLPVRAKTVSRIRHLHFEWRIDLDHLPIYQQPFLSSDFMRIRQHLSVELFEGLDTVRVHVRLPLDATSPPTHPRACLSDILKVMEPDMDMLIDIIPQCCKALKVLELVGIFPRSHLDKYERKLGLIKMSRGRQCVASDVGRWDAADVNYLEFCPTL
ncbi:hypothetical protein MN608_09182 [Microdochium nivale]|nr:hypothetical protein MN608_09182 [Microdochium nivale]